MAPYAGFDTIQMKCVGYKIKEASISIILRIDS